MITSTNNNFKPAIVSTLSLSLFLFALAAAVPIVGATTTTITTTAFVGSGDIVPTIPKSISKSAAALSTSSTLPLGSSLLVQLPRLQSVQRYNNRALLFDASFSTVNETLSFQENDGNNNNNNNSNDSNNNDSNNNIDNRRSFLANVALTTTSTLALTTSIPPTANSIPNPFDTSSSRRQLELCLISILRTLYWATKLSASLNNKLLQPPTTPDMIEFLATLSDRELKQPYLEARLGAKALLTQKIGGGASERVMNLATFQLKECLDDGKYWCGVLGDRGELPGQQLLQQQIQQQQIPNNGSSNGSNINRKLSNKQTKTLICNQSLLASSDNLIESLASLVEFDGLETTIDPSPRSSLMLSMYTRDKGVFVYRTLMERVIPSCESYLDVFGRERREFCEEYVRSNYGEEVPYVVKKVVINT